MRSHLTFLCVLPFVIVSTSSAISQEKQSAKGNEPPVIEEYREEATKRWEKAILQLEEKNGDEAHSEDSILFIGSSSIRRWNTIEEDVAPYKPIQRGYGGARFTDVAVYARRLIAPHQYRAMVVFVANDIRGKADDLTPDEVAPLVRHVLEVSQRHQPEAPVLLIEITPTSSRFAAWDKIRGLNARLRDIALTTPHVYFIPTASHYLSPAGQPRNELFVKDLLHLNREGYRIWGSLVRRRLDDALRLETTARLNESATTGTE